MQHNFDQLFKKILKDVQVEITQQFDRNFERKAFFDQKREESRLKDSRGSMMIRTGMLRNSIRSRIEGNSIRFSSAVPYASLHNEGGKVVVTAKMKRFFWAMYYKVSGGVSTKKNGSARNNKRNETLSTEAAQWKALALQKVGKVMTIKQRQFIGDHQQVRAEIQRIVNENLEELKITNK